jgi:short subunit dehydrogenase-like uncharacterized protein
LTNTSRENREFDVIIWGASGFTGRIATNYMHAQYGDGNISWAIAGRNHAKLDSVRNQRDIDVLIAESDDEESLRELAQKTKVLLTTVGPYSKYGSKLVATCAEYGTDYCDLTGESLWMREMISAYDESARNSGARIVHTCGFDSIPSDIGAYFLQKEMIARHGVPARHIKFRLRTARGGMSGGTADSGLAMIEKVEKDKNLRSQLTDPYLLNNNFRGADGSDRISPFYDEDFDSWVAPFVMGPINTRVVRRSAELLGDMYGSNFRYDEGILTRGGPTGFLGATGIGLATGLAMATLAAPPTRKIIKRLIPKPGEGPSEQDQARGFFEIELKAKHPDDEALDLRAIVKGDRDPGYGSTAKMIVESALALAHDDIKKGGGFWTPASVIGDQLLQRLPLHAGVTFELVS